jgi:hypothetical protein
LGVIVVYDGPAPLSGVSGFFRCVQLYCDEFEGVSPVVLSCWWGGRV